MHAFSLTANTQARTFRRLSLALLGLALLAGANANAACGDPAHSRPGVMPKMPVLTQPGGRLGPTNSKSIVGLWHVTYTAGGQFFYEAFDEWHSDGTEFENANVPPAIGNVCFGVWAQVAPRTVQLSHIGWAFDPSGDSIGTFTLAETNTVSSDGSAYQGSFDYKFYDINGVLQQEVTGTLAATRLGGN